MSFSLSFIASACTLDLAFRRVEADLFATLLLSFFRFRYRFYFFSKHVLAVSSKNILQTNNPRNFKSCEIHEQSSRIVLINSLFEIYDKKHFKYTCKGAHFILVLQMNSL